MATIPFDTQICAFEMESAANKRKLVEFVWNPIANIYWSSSSTTQHNSNLVQKQAVTDSIKKDDNSRLKVILQFTRDRTWYYLVLFIPSSILVTTSFRSLWLDWNPSFPRLSMVLFTFGQLILSRLRLPTNLTVINIWNYTCMIFTFLALLESFINSLAQRETSRNADHIDQQRNREALIRRMKEIDTIARYIFPIAFIFILILSYSYYYFYFNDKYYNAQN